MSHLDIRYHRDHHQFYLYLPAPRSDGGAPQWYATLLTPEEAMLWRAGCVQQLRKRLVARGVGLDSAPVQGRPRLLARAWRWLMGWCDTLLLGK